MSSNTTRFNPVGPNLADLERFLVLAEEQERSVSQIPRIEGVAEQNLGETQRRPRHSSESIDPCPCLRGCVSPHGGFGVLTVTVGLIYGLVKCIQDGC